jgi:hypothetical protein
VSAPITDVSREMPLKINQPAVIKAKENKKKNYKQKTLQRSKETDIT